MTIVFTTFNYRVEHRGNHDDIASWCNKTFGSDQWTLIGPDVYGFINEMDKTMFILRWS